MKFISILLLLTIGCTVRTTESTTQTDSLVDTVATEVLRDEDADTESSANEDDDVGEYAGFFRLGSSSAAEQARLNITYNGNNTFDFYLNFTVADFCSEDHNGGFVINEQQTGTFTVDDNRKLTFRFEAGTIVITDEGGELGVGTCNVSGTFLECDGACDPISWDSYDDAGEYEGEPEEEVVATDTVQ